MLVSDAVCCFKNVRVVYPSQDALASNQAFLGILIVYIDLNEYL